MPTGTSLPIPLQHDETLTPIHPNDSYFSIWLHSVQAYVEAPWLTQTAYLVCSTEVQSTFLPDHTSQSIHKVTTVHKNTPCPLGLRVQLTDWLPAIPDKVIKIDVKLVAVRDNPFGRLTDKIAQFGLAAMLSLVGAKLGEGAKIAEIAGRILSVLLEEGKETVQLMLHADVPVDNLQSGYAAVIASHVSGDIPGVPRLRKDGRIEDTKAPFSEKNTYAVLEVRALERRGPEAARTTPWWSVLQDGRRQAQRLAAGGERERRKANTAWLDTLERAERLAEEDRSFLMNEIRSIFQETTQEIRQALHPSTTPEASLDDEFPEELQRILGVTDAGALSRAVDAYHQALERSQDEI